MVELLAPCSARCRYGMNQVLPRQRRSCAWPRRAMLDLSLNGTPIASRSSLTRAVLRQVEDVLVIVVQEALARRPA